MDSLNSKIEKLLYYIFLGAQIHSTLANISTSYSHFVETMSRKLTKKLGLKSTLWDEIVDFVCYGNRDLKPKTETIEVFGKEQNDLFQAFLLDNLVVEKTIRGKTAYQAKDCIKLSNGELYLDSLERPSYIDEDVRHSIRSFHHVPDCLKDHGVTTTREGLDASRITFATFNGYPFVIQRNTEENEPMSLTIISSDGQQLGMTQFKKKFDEEVKYHSYYEGWVCRASDNGGKVELNYLDDVSIALRHNSADTDLDLFSDDVKSLVQDELPHFFMKKYTVDQKHGTRRGYLIEGLSGTGKTALVKKIISLVPKDYTILLIGNDLGALASIKKYPFFFPILVIIEDLNLILPAADAVHTQMLTNFLDGIDSPDNVITVMTSTNMKEVSTLITERYGRVDRVIKLGYGDEKIREKQLEIIAEGLSLPYGYSFAKIASDIKECSMSTLKEMIKRASVYSHSNVEISEKALLRAIDELGLKKANPAIPENQKQDEPLGTPQEHQTESRQEQGTP